MTALASLYRHLIGWRSGGQSIRLVVAVAVVVTVIMIAALLAGAWLAMQAATAERQQLEHNLDQQAQNVVAHVDREVLATFNLLAALASSHALQTDNVDGFRRKALEISQQLGIQIVLRRPGRDGQTMNTAVSGAPAPTAAIPALRMEAEAELLRTQRPVVSNVFTGPLTHQAVVAALVPVLREGRIDYVLSIGIPTEKFAQLLKSDSPIPGRIAAILDRNHVFVARSERHADYTGTPVQKSGEPYGTSGEVASVNRDGTPFHWFYRRSDLTGWVTGVGVPTSVLEASSNRVLIHYSLAGALLLILAITLSCGLGTWISRSSGRLGIDREPTREEFRILFEAAPNGVLLVDSAGAILLTNARLERDFGYGRGELIGQPVDMLVPLRYRAGHAELRRGYAGAPAMRRMGSGRDLNGQRKDGSEFPIEIGLNPISTGAGQFVMATVVDITARKRAAERLSAAARALKTSEDQMQLAVDAAELGIWTWDMAADKWFWSDRVCEIVGVPPGTLNSREAYIEHVHPSDAHLLEENRDRCLAGHPDFDLEYRIVQPHDGAIRWLASNGRVDLDANGSPLRARGVLQDITARKLAEIARDELRRQLMQAQEQERLRLAQELHDQTGQGLAVALLSLKGLESDSAESRKDQLQGLRRQLEQMGQTLNRVAWELRPAAIDELGLTVVLADYVAEWGRQFAIKAEFDCRDGRLNALPDEIHTTIYRVVQEALTNIAKHAKSATAVSVVINRVAGVLRLTIEDNGPGLVRAAAEPDATPRKGGLGLAGMRERLALIGGILEIETTPHGVTIFARIPLESARLSA